jgi:hypothetical protein
VYEHIRANLAKDIAATQQRVTAAIAQRDQVAATLAQQQAGLPPLQAAVAAAQQALDARNRDLAAAQAVVDQRTAERDAAEDERDAAQEAFDRNGGDEPPFFDDPADLRRWQQVHDVLKAALHDAQQVLDDANAVLQQAAAVANIATANVQSAAAVVANAQDRVNAQNAAIAATEQQLAAAEAGITAARRDVDVLDAKVVDLDQREATLTAGPLDRPALEHAADVEEADLQTGWRHRRDLFERRVHFRQARAGVLAAHDVTIDELAVLRSQIAGSTEATVFAGLPPIVSALDRVIADNAAQRQRSPLDRTDDLVAVRGRLAELTTALQDVTGPATTARDNASHDLAVAREALITHQEPA